MLATKKRTRRHAPRQRDPERTRERLLQSAFKEVHKSGFQNTDVDTILDAAGVTKGALYHHFENKESLGYAIVDEVISGINLEKWVRPLRSTLDPVGTLIEIIESTPDDRDSLRRGCPLNNLAQEMSPLDEGFRRRLAKIFDDFRGAVAHALRDGQKRGVVKRDFDPEETALFVVATYEGYMSIAKNSQDPRVLESGKRSMARFLETLRADRLAAREGISA